MGLSNVSDTLQNIQLLLLLLDFGMAIFPVLLSVHLSNTICVSEPIPFSKDNRPTSCHAIEIIYAQAFFFFFGRLRSIFSVILLKPIIIN